ncbi:hypothetical protein HMPREF0351_12893 (plasmid) [Enterococcus faecium DO]|uniref:Uncharacterized protein n=1 Tax=Enterococcus faecium (strain ATCC BAA-472 / TX0016 / DO) TaxID=333849 RepID=I3U679_ENTFD|nr:hypothetical protein HMPREF0351_12893 [Enterococcus faecium DO]
MDIQEFPQNDVVGDSILPEILYVFLFFYKKLGQIENFHQS